MKNENTPQGTSIDPVSNKTFAEVLGEIVWIMNQSADIRPQPIAEIERLVMPGILLRQFHIQYVENTTSGAGTKETEAGKLNLQPVSVVVYAMVSDAVKQALEVNPELTLTLQDWHSGPHKRAMLEISLLDKTLQKPAAKSEKPHVLPN
ncbi:toxin-activating lysine-acyltransferase [Pseudovibrio sp. Tun.PSC04-5.I4]|uniref:toxin-activating lysine-acyltransferase n=1 Tax=Pseudovibrio sp. Tun.PSC04-5.I4 TaxID=1798213 RepID=UPI000892669A|nr:toxin-activating lysine-acyltransferase [Pseudovibrio sp. Tun.PSC04-5.I4]SDR48897.1 RTX toxin acyltransferase family protein [Pseudovibrio sp. Tun.PSC04-5.I4]